MEGYFRNDNLNYEPVIRARLRNPLNGKSLVIELVIDTGFQGGVLIPLKTYVDLNLNLLEEPKVIAKTAVGAVIELRRAKVVIELSNSRITCTAYTSLAVRKPLLGREVLKGLGLLYKPPNELKLNP